MNKSFYFLSFMMGVVVLSSNYLVQFPMNYYGLNEILTYGAFSYPIAFLITDLANRSFGKNVARKIVYFGFFLGIGFTTLVSSSYSNCSAGENLSKTFTGTSSTAGLSANTAYYLIIEPQANTIVEASTTTYSIIVAAEGN